jgi:hypothetical protein
MTEQPGLIEQFTIQEQADMRARLRDVEKQTALNTQALSNHEERCAGRYKITVFLMLVLIALAAWDKIVVFMPMLTLLKMK